MEANILLIRDGGDTPRPLPDFSTRFGATISIFGQIPAERGLAGLIGGDFSYSIRRRDEGEDDYLRRALAEVLAAESNVVFIHLKGPDEPGHDGLPGEKVRAIELIDQHFIGPLMDATCRDDVIAVTSDHATHASSASTPPTRSHGSQGTGHQARCDHAVWRTLRRERQAGGFKGYRTDAPPHFPMEQWVILPAMQHVRVRSILHSGGGPAAEAEVTLRGGARGRGSAPVGLRPGLRERRASGAMSIGSDFTGQVAACLELLRSSQIGSQDDIDQFLERNMKILGVDVSLAISLAYAKAAATSLREPLASYFAALGGTTPRMPRIMTAVISGGIHDEYRSFPFQQLMIVPVTQDTPASVGCVLAIYDETERRLRDRGMLVGYSSSSGLLTNIKDVSAALDILFGVLHDTSSGAEVSVAIDVAAEHFNQNGLYRVGCGMIAPGEMLEFLAALTSDFGISILEDPFAYSDEEEWRRLRKRIGDHTVILGDDLFATDSNLIDRSLAGGAILKMSQIGTVSGTIAAGARAATLGMKTCASHRSYETEDTSVCHLAVGLGTDWIKIGGPRRGDRVAKYNELLRLSETYGL